MRHPGQVVSAADLLRQVWDEHADRLTETVRVTVGTLRRKLNGNGEPSVIETVPGKGYRLGVTA
jgi:DNA-binding response OmpR family regulator